MARGYLENHVWGTPEMSLEKIEGIAAHIRPDELIVVPRYTNMTAPEAERSLKLFAEQVLPAVQAIEHAPVAAA